MVLPKKDLNSGTLLKISLISKKITCSIDLYSTKYRNSKSLFAANTIRILITKENFWRNYDSSTVVISNKEKTTEEIFWKTMEEFFE